jgi:hypothetical protein
VEILTVEVLEGSRILIIMVVHFDLKESSGQRNNVSNSHHVEGLVNPKVRALKKGY